MNRCQRAVIILYTGVEISDSGIRTLAALTAEHGHMTKGAIDTLKISQYDQEGIEKLLICDGEAVVIKQQEAENVTNDPLYHALVYIGNQYQELLLSADYLQFSIALTADIIRDKQSFVQETPLVKAVNVIATNNRSIPYFNTMKKYHINKTVIDMIAKIHRKLC